MYNGGSWAYREKQRVDRKGRRFFMALKNASDLTIVLFEKNGGDRSELSVCLEKGCF